MINVIVGFNIVTIIAVLLMLTCLKEKIDYYTDSSSTFAILVVAIAICSNLIFSKLANIASERVKIEAKIEALSDVGYRALTEEELLDLSPNQLKEYIQVGDVYFTTDSTN